MGYRLAPQADLHLNLGQPPLQTTLSRSESGYEKRLVLRGPTSAKPRARAGRQAAERVRCRRARSGAGIRLEPTPDLSWVVPRRQGPSPERGLRRCAAGSSSCRGTGRKFRTSAPTSNWRGNGFRRPWLCPCRLTLPRSMPFQRRNG